ncbi:Bifunctional inhibitor/plant lipid transfer protein/seed storage helical domain-containing protein [Artemisia annua]|uniref:Bifunctional inhibitor/plant lipid transfer protein/seed storage helical domain-containing protein n=1 Tax=Artemisia annua TaxID=35608 RepID=A0A2U1MW95_ARTAN|nr:Bifunctional inhibitor/plant lipid transfer protein/seed storage helical domain-containing protein [Artemisia annua]
MKVLSIIFVMVAMLVLLTAEVQVTKAANCNENVLLAECGENLREGGVPSATCCGILKDQQPCICGYPDHNNWPGLPKICGFCDVPLPHC